MVTAHHRQLALSVSAAVRTQTLTAALEHAMVQASLAHERCSTALHVTTAALHWGQAAVRNPARAVPCPQQPSLQSNPLLGSAEQPLAGGCRLEDRHAGRLSQLWPDMICLPQG